MRTHSLTDRLLVALGLCLLFGRVPPAFGDYDSTVKTPRGSNVYVRVKTWELSAAEIAQFTADATAAYPQATVLAPASRKYNCHSYAWHSQATTSNDKWMPWPTAYMTDGSYKPVGMSSVPVPDGARVYYPGLHSAIKVSAYHFKSKWGSLPLMKHKPAYCPYDATVLTYWVRVP